MIKRIIRRNYLENKVLDSIGDEVQREISGIKNLWEMLDS